MKKKRDGLPIIGERLARVDRKLVELLRARALLSEEVARCKMLEGKTILQMKTEKKRINQFVSWAKELGLDQEFARALYFLIIAESCRIQISIKEKISKCSLKR